MYTQAEILNFLKANKPFLQEKFDIVKLGLVGSYAKGMQTPESDVDILIEYAEGTNELLEKRLGLEKFFRSKLGIKVDIAREKYVRPSIKRKLLSYAIFV